MKQPSQRIARGSEEFARVLGFSDAVFAIAMTLLVVGIGVPTLSDEGSVGELWDDLGDLFPEILSFFISFAVIGRYWIAHHRFFARLGAFEYGLLWVNLVYLAFVAFLPFPTALLGNYFDNPLSVSTYAITVALISGLEVALMRRAHDVGLMSRPMPEPIYRWGVNVSSLPVAFMLASVPVAFLSSAVAVIMWFLSAPVQALVLDRNRPPGASDWF